MVKRSGAVGLAVGALLALACPSAAAGQDPSDGGALPFDVTGGFASWASADAGLADRGVYLAVTEPAVRASGDRAWFPATGGGADPATGAGEVRLGGAARLGGPADSVLVLGGLRLRLTGGEGALYARTAVDGQARELALAEVSADGAAPVVREGGVTWAGLRASLTAEGADLLASWSGREFAPGDGLGVLDVTVGTGGSEASAGEPALSSPSVTEPEERRTPTAALALPTLTAGTQQTVTGEGFTPGGVVLVAIDGDTRYQAVADEEGRIAVDFPVYANAVEGEHAVELYSVTGEQARATAGFDVD